MTKAAIVALCRCIWALIKCMRAVCYNLMYLKLIDHAEYSRMKGFMASAGGELNEILRIYNVREEVYDGTV